MDLTTFVIICLLLGLVYHGILQYQKQKARADVIQYWLDEHDKKQNEGSGDINTGKQARTTGKRAKMRIQILFSSQRGTSKTYATKLFQQLKKIAKSVTLRNMNKFDPERITQQGHTDLLIIFAPTYDNGLPSDDGRAFYEWLDDLSLDFRVHKNMLHHLNYAIMGLGDSAFGPERFCQVAKKMERCLKKLSATSLVPTELGDNGAGNDVNKQFNAFRERLINAISASPDTHQSKSRDDHPTDISKAVEILSDSDDEGEPMLDIEDMAPTDETKHSADSSSTDVAQISTEDVPEMLTPLLRKSLEKQGYKLFGSHSGVKLCRWTKAMLRGRGGCYKHTAYGITSYRCMEMTPSLACASKCVFCWRHHSNPVARSWKWKVDEPEFLIQNAVENHVKMINSMRGVPGVQKERFEEAFVPKHCALSLVGEPIIYPHIGKFLNLLHEKNISSFLVTNAQFPEQMENVDKVTQLYISVDASNPEALKKIDRPIFEDYWERFLECIDIMKRKKMRTVFRLTLVKSWNMNEMREYAELIKRGEPMFIEIKGVTYCGNSKSSDLTMKNVPFHEEVKDFAFKLCQVEGMEDYEPACIHEHSCFVLIAHKNFRINGEWHTWIDYERFHELVHSGEDFDAFDYVAKTPEWCLIESEEQGFDPAEERVYRKGKKKGKKEPVQQEYSAGGC
uniref:tRNA 4-demethylwyosine synthase (AdoMet-dependent) n=1 Tax=Percolomonas cosmopolitus TaxID=63605 RepID=A0A7S1KRP4_9EUKA